jgi:hypothetical protein
MLVYEIVCGPTNAMGWRGFVLGVQFPHLTMFAYPFLAGSAF